MVVISPFFIQETSIYEIKQHMVLIIPGTRPEIIKLSPIIRECKSRNIPYFTLHTGQHYSYEMDRIFFEELELPQPKYNLDVGSGRADRTIAPTPVPGELKDYKNTGTMVCTGRRF